MERLSKLRRSMEALGLDALMVNSPANRRYLTGFTGTEAHVVVTGRELYVMSDFRYREQIGEQVKNGKFVEVAQGQYGAAMGKLFADHSVKRVGFEANLLTYAEYRRLSDQLDSVEWVPAAGLVEQIRMIKDEGELAILQEACELADRAFEHAAAVIRPGMTERDVALELEFFMQRGGAKAPSFDTIVASGVRSSMPHGVASGKTLQDGEFVTLDFGALYRGYCSDITRTLFLGTPTDKHLEIYKLVLKAQTAVIERLRPGMKGCDAHQIAVDIIAEGGYGECFGHGTGHGIGLEIHEAPRLSATYEGEMVPGMVVTVEPGIYVPGFGGVRIEDDVVITEDGCRRLTGSTKELLTVRR